MNLHSQIVFLFQVNIYFNHLKNVVIHFQTKTGVQTFLLTEENKCGHKEA